MITENHIKELDIEYDRQALENFYHEIKHRAIPYIEVHTDYLEEDAEHSPYFRCICPKCLPTGKHEHSGNNHKFIRRLDRFKNPEVDRITEQLEKYTKCDSPNKPVMWIYEPGFVLPPHKDYLRHFSIMVPILPAEGGATVDIYDNNLPIINKESYTTVEHNEDNLIGVHTYKVGVPTALNANQVIHGVRNQKQTRVFINFSGYSKWDCI